MKLNERLLQRRRELGMTLEEVGRIVGVNRSTVKRYESGQTKKIPYTTLEKLAVALKTTPEYLSGTGGQEKTFDGLDDDIRLLARDMKKLPKDKIELLKSIVKTMSKAADGEIDGK